jgi:AraC family transcriptional regulator
MDSWDNINAVQRMQSYIGSHLHEPITLHMLADAAGYSPWHAAKIFKSLTGKSPFEYIRALRLSRAAVRLRDDDVRIVDVAFDFVFDSHEGFTRAFSKQFGLTPQHFSRSKPPIKLFIPNDVREYYLALKKGDHKMSETQKASTIFVQVVDRPPRKMILKRGIKLIARRWAARYGMSSAVSNKPFMNQSACGCPEICKKPAHPCMPRELRSPWIMPAQSRKVLS